MTTLDKTGIEAARNEFVHSTTKEQIERWAYKWADDLLSTADALSSLPAQAVGVPNGWHLVPDHPTDAMMQAGLYQASADAKWADVFSSYVDMVRIAPSPEDALVAPSQPAAVGERADALWEQLLPLMQVEECPPGDPYKDKVAALALIEAALVHRDQVKL